MIDKTYTKFYENWYYRKIGDEYQALQAAQDNLGVIAEIKKCPVNEFVKRLSKTSQWTSVYDYDPKDVLIICDRYPWIKYYHREILMSKIRKPIIFALWVTAIVNKDFTLSEYILKAYNLTQNDAKTWKLDTLDGYDDVILQEVKYGQTIYYLKNQDHSFGKTVSYNVGELHCIDGNVRYALSERLIEQLNDCTKTFYKNLSEIFEQTNGFHLADFGLGRYIGYRREQTGNYHFVVIKKTNEQFSYLYQTFTSAIAFVTQFDFVRWGTLRGEAAALKESSLPLLLSAKESGDKFLECEIKYLTHTATQAELDYLNQNDTTQNIDRFYLKKDIYDLRDIQILSVSSRIMRWVGKVFECQLVIEGKKLNVRFKLPYNPQNKPQNLELAFGNKYTTFRFSVTQRVVDKFAQLIGTKI